MIGCTKLLCGTATVSDVIKHSSVEGQVPPELLQFSNQNRPLVVWNMTNAATYVAGIATSVRKTASIKTN